MISQQIERLKRDSRELENYERKLRNKGKLDLASKMQSKRAFLDQHIDDLKKVG